MGYLQVGQENGLTFADLRDADLARLPQFRNNLGETAHAQPDGSDWTLLEWAGAAAGEMGEAANIAKKFRRGDYSIENPAHVEALADEIADVVIYSDLLAARAGIDLGEAVRRKFNKTSAKVGSDVRL